MAHHEWTRAELGCIAGNVNLLGEKRAGIAVAPTAVTVAGRVQRHHAKLINQKRCDEAPPFEVGVAAMDQGDAWIAGFAPGLIVDAAAVYLDVAGFTRGFDGSIEPEGR